jgi:4-hydroxybenzoyl-CoA reductase subunit beta
VIIPAFELHRPTTLDEALGLATKFAPEMDFIAGGTDLLQNYKNRIHVKPRVVALEHVRELRGIAPEGRIGAMERLADVAAHPMVREKWAGLAEAVGQVASPLVRNSGTIGGNLLVETRCFYFNQTWFWRTTKGSCMKAESDECLVIPQKETCYAAYSGDVAPALLVLGASVELAKGDRRRVVPLVEFYRGDGIEKNVLERGEILVAIRIPDDAARLRSGYRKLRTRETLDYPEMGVAAALRTDDAGRVEELRVATTAVDVVPQYADFGAEHRGKRLVEIAEAVAAEMEDRAQPKKNTAMPVGYRKKMVRVFLRRLLGDLASEGKAPSA